MKEWIQPVLGALLGAAVGTGAVLLAGPAPGAARGAGPDSLGELRQALGEVRAEQAELTRRLEELPAAPAAAVVPGARVAVPDLDRAVAEYMARQEPVTVSDDGGPSADDVLTADRLLSGALSRDEVQQVWKELRASGRIDAVLMEIERQAALEPGNPDLQNELGKAYLQKLFDSGIGPTAMQWGEKADKAFDQALAVDDHHWEARFQKAMAMSNWPGFMGKQADSMKQFEILVRQQEAAGTSHSGYPMTYLFLGNLYEQSGDHEKARATWERGANLFPTSEGLADRLRE
jgi:tetratricopeptide (TPR) repeat protein